MKLLLWGLSCLFFCGTVCAREGQKEAPVEEDISGNVQEGQLFSVQKEVALLKEAYPAVKLYVQGLLFSRPLPWPYHLEGFDVREGKVFLQGRLMSPGAYEIPLGVLWWGGRAYALPSFSRTSVPIQLPVLSVQDLLLPFPDKAMLPTPQNEKVESQLLMDNQERGMEFLTWKDFWRHVLIIVCLVLVCIPCAYQFFKWWRVNEQPKETLPVITPAVVFQEIKHLQQQGQTPWEKLVYVLNLVTSQEMPSLTSYELERRFAAAGQTGLAEASACIENYGYRPDGGQYFDHAVLLIERELVAKNLF